MAKVVRMPRKSDARPASVPSKGGCEFKLKGRTIEIDCSGCSSADDAPSDRCMGTFRRALIAHREAMGMIMRGTQDVWVRESGVYALRTLLSAETAWEGLRTSLISLPCRRPIPSDRVDHYLERARGGSPDLFCQGEGADCTACLVRQREVIDVMRSDGRKARKTLAADRFRIIEVPGGDER